MIHSHRNKPGVNVAPSALPLSLATLDAKRDIADALVSKITTLDLDERCDTCAWPDTCAADRTCWHAERAQTWQRARIDNTPKQVRTWTRDLVIAWVHDFHERYGRVPHSYDVASLGAPNIDTIKRHGFPRLADLVREAGYEPHKPRRAKKKAKFHLSQSDDR